MSKLLSVIIAGRNEMFFKHTVEDVLKNIRGDSEVIAVCDGNWPEPALGDHPRLTVVHHDSIGQRAAVNEGARISQAKYVMKLDAHCSVDEGFDVKLAQDCQPDWTLIPTLWNLHAFDWKCLSCGNQTYQGSKPVKCLKCGGSDFEMVMIWEPRRKKVTYSWRFDKDMHFQYWRNHHKRPEWKDEPIIETMSCNGPGFFMERERFWDLDGMDEATGSWGQMGTELACKAWLSGGKMMTTRNTWFAHMFRTGNFSRNGECAFPYPLSNKQQRHAIEYSKDLWLNDKWPKATRKLEWLIERFSPVPSWHDEKGNLL